MMTLVKLRKRLAMLAGFALVPLALTSCAATGATPSDTTKPEPGSTSSEAWTVEESAQARALLPESVTESGTITVGGESGRAPFRFNEGDELVGLEVDIMTAIGEVLGVEIAFEHVPGLAPTLLALSSERIDIAFGPFRPNAERQAQFDYVNFMVDGNGFLVLADGGPALKSLPDDVCGLSVAYLESSNAAEYLETTSVNCEAAGLDPVDAQGISSQESMILGVLSGRYDAGTTASPLGNFGAAQNDKLVFFDDPVRGSATLGSLTSKQRPEMGEALFAAFEELYSQGVLEKIMTKWGQQDAMTDEPTQLD